MNFAPNFQTLTVTSKVDSLLARSLLYREFQAEREEILRHKWFESEKAGRDIGFESALVSWVVHHRAQWRKARQQRLQADGLLWSPAGHAGPERWRGTAIHTFN